jgi:nicotinamide-nucleotide amidase
MTVEQLADRALELGVTIGVAESLTCGTLSSGLGVGGEASKWFRGGIVAYSTAVKRELLGVTAPRAITADCATQMAEGALRALGADLAVSTTGAGGPGEEEGRPAGTVFIAVAWPAASEVREFHFTGEPSEVLGQTVDAAIRMLETRLGLVKDT